MPAEIRLLATDLDGTVAAARDTETSLRALAEGIGSLKSRFGTKWAVLTGRSKRRALQMLNPLAAVNLSPDYLILRFVYLNKLTPIGYVPCVFHNARILWRLLRDPLAARHVIDDWYETNVAKLEGMRTLIRSEYRLRLRFEREEDAARVAASLGELIAPFSHMCTLLSGCEVVVTTVPYIKGLSLAELSRRLGIERRHILAIGNGRNDLSIIDQRVAAMCGCPTNSDSRVIQAVHDAGGHLAKERSMAAVAEIISAYLKDCVRSELPADWRASRLDMNVSERPWSSQFNRPTVKRVFILVLALYMILLVFAGFDLIPFSAWIRKPYEFVIWNLARLF